jgi:nitrite reductase/ring-hydroxylating ferredoxin subunit
MADAQRLICASGDLQEGGKGVRFNVLWHGRLTPAFVVRHKGKPHAFLNRCGHLPLRHRQMQWQWPDRLAR